MKETLRKPRMWVFALSGFGEYLPSHENRQAHDVPNPFVTDGACMTSSACQNPSLTYMYMMALTARACVHAADEMKSGAIWEPA